MNPDSPSPVQSRFVPRTRPNFFLLGAPKCGTTAMASYLEAHPQVLLSKPKEAKFFHTDFEPSHRLVHDEVEYLACFGENPELVPAVGEATVWYLYSQVAVNNILRFNPQARFLVMVRHPVELCHSLHAQLLFGGDEDVKDFEAAWRLQPVRAVGHAVPRFCRDPKSLQYGAIARLGEQLERLYAQVPKQRVHVTVFDDFTRDPERAYHEVLEFLGLEARTLIDPPVVNASRRVTLGPLASTLRFLGYLKRRIGIRRSFGIWRLATPLFSRSRSRPPLSPDFRRELVEFFRDDVDHLAGLLGRDLTKWKS